MSPGWQCALDDAAFASCTSPVSYLGLAARPAPVPGRATVDSYGGVDPNTLGAIVDRARAATRDAARGRRRSGGQRRQASRSAFGAGDRRRSPMTAVSTAAAFAPCQPPLTVSRAPPRAAHHRGARRRLRRTGRSRHPPVGRSTCRAPSTAASVIDLDRDLIPDSSEILPIGNVPPLAGVRTLATLVSGDARVKLPVGHGSLRQSAPLAGFVPLKGIAALPVGTIVDARRGTLSLQTAVDGRSVADPQRRLGQARLSAAIFQIRQARARQRRVARPPDRDRGSRRSARRRPGTVAAGTLRQRRGAHSDATAKGFFRVSGGASFAQSQNAAWRTSDRCDGTMTQVRRGSVRLYDKRRAHRDRSRRSGTSRGPACPRRARPACPPDASIAAAGEDGSAAPHGPQS